ncbi:sulfite exporter TauE/SafE family protein [Vogesella indigofera]|uniref:sulfite exporter TauE/SafE family protein n=1 Tax=Vogesella indigofera TaxID=45465 RepID=UPI00234EE5B7|nr:sulfite exporter TauE/SafE family protein [Vogesella indigofera]MDC7710535.1 sulfite exporter TauE/SafE family protein [Vogesella indigofera]
MDPGYIIAGLAVGFIVGLTGVGGGSLMTPILLWFGINPATAVGTDLLYACITKMGGVWVHHKHKHIDWRITKLLAIGSVPASLLTVIVLHYLQLDTQAANSLIKVMLGFALILTALAILFKPWILRQIARFMPARPEGYIPTKATVFTGVVLGVIVTLSSIGAGALGTLAIFALYPLLPTARLVGTEIAHAVPLTLVAGLGHASMGNMDYGLLVQLLIGSLPGIWLGSHLTRRVAERWLRPALALMMALIGAKLVL